MTPSDSPTEPRAAALVPFVLCADDYALAPGVSRAIVTLIAAGRLSATSALVVGRFWPEHAGWLVPVAGKAEIGLHLALSDFPALGAVPSMTRAGRMPSLSALAALAFTGRLARPDLADEISRQLDAFEAGLGRRPDFVDGHKHVHLLPIVRDVLMETLSRRYGARRPWLRQCDEKLTAIARRGVAVPQAMAISLLARPLRRIAQRAGWPVNRRFAGVRNFSERAPYRELFKRFVGGAPAGLVVMCHPGHADADLAALDPVVAQREAEFAYLAGPHFADDLEQAGMALAPPARA